MTPGGMSSVGGVVIGAGISGGRTTGGWCGGGRFGVTPVVYVWPEVDDVLLMGILEVTFVRQWTLGRTFRRQLLPRGDFFEFNSPFTERDSPPRKFPPVGVAWCVLDSR